MSVFGAYSRYYDLLYRDKNYDGEADFIDRLVREYGGQARTLLELGCGSGKHAACLADKGYEIAGVDISRDMLEAADARLKTLPLDIARRLSFAEGDVRTVRLQRKFDCAISLFHVISYQPGNADLLAAFATARAHLDAGGVFIFDCWYGPAVLSDPPAVRIKRMSDDDIEVTRLAEPVWHPNENLVDVNYAVFIRERASGAVEELRETHRMRYLFTPEVHMLASTTGFRMEHSCEWLSGKAPGENTWGVCFVLRAT